jgi:hypothetical protein
LIVACAISCRGTLSFKGEAAVGRIRLERGDEDVIGGLGGDAGKGTKVAGCVDVWATEIPWAFPKSMSPTPFDESPAEVLESRDGLDAVSFRGDDPGPGGRIDGRDEIRVVQTPVFLGGGPQPPARVLRVDPEREGGLGRGLRRGRREPDVPSHAKSIAAVVGEPVHLGGQRCRQRESRRRVSHRREGIDRVRLGAEEGVEVLVSHAVGDRDEEIGLCSQLQPGTSERQAEGDLDRPIAPVVSESVASTRIASPTFEKCASSSRPSTRARSAEAGRGQRYGPPKAPGRCPAKASSTPDVRRSTRFHARCRPRPSRRRRPRRARHERHPALLPVARARALEDPALDEAARSVLSRPRKKLRGADNAAVRIWHDIV